MRFTSRWIAVLSALCLLLSLSPLSAIALSSGEFEYSLTDDQTAAVITGYKGSAVDVVIPETINGAPVIRIDNKAFYDQKSIQSVAFPSTLQTIGNAAFQNCSSLTAIDLPESVISIGEMAFFNCESLRSIQLSDFTYDIGFQAFHNTPWLVFSNNGPVYVGRVLYTYFGLMKNGTEVTVKDGTAAIAPSAFENRTELKAVYLPVGLRMIGDYAFANCANLQTVRIPPSVQTIGNHILTLSTAATIHCVKSSPIGIYAGDNDLYAETDSTLDYLDGDMDKSSTVDSTDLRLLMRAVNNMDDAYDHERFLSCDIVYDGVINTRDVREWMQLSIL